MGSFFQIGTSPLMARQGFPIGMFLVGVLAVAILVVGIWFFTKHLIDYKKSDKYIQKQLSRMTTQKDVKKFCDTHRLNSKLANQLWNMCRIKKLPNINYYIKEHALVTEAFKEYYFYLKQNNASLEDINDFFELNFQVEKICAASKSLLSTKQLTLESVVFYLTHESEQFPFYVKANTTDYFALEIPKFMYENPNLKPPLLERLRFITKSADGMTFHFTTRAMRYQNNLILTHSEDHLNQAHRNSKREPIDAECTFSPARIAREEERSKQAIKNKEEEFIVSPKEYPGKVTNISTGGCCIKTNLPIKEKQHLSVLIPTLDINEHIIGIIRKTRKLIDNTYNLHIQFLKISLPSKNKINAYAFKYEI